MHAQMNDWLLHKQLPVMQQLLRLCYNSHIKKNSHSKLAYTKIFKSSQTYLSANSRLEFVNIVVHFLFCVVYKTTVLHVYPELFCMIYP